MGTDEGCPPKSQSALQELLEGMWEVATDIPFLFIKIKSPAEMVGFCWCIIYYPVMRVVQMKLDCAQSISILMRYFHADTLIGAIIGMGK